MIQPMFAMVLLIFIVGLFNVSWRIRAVRAGQIKLSCFRLFQPGEADIPAHILAGGKNYSNLFEVPLLFLIGAALVISQGLENTAFVILGWLFVASRVAHTLRTCKK